MAKLGYRDTSKAARFRLTQVRMIDHSAVNDRDRRIPQETGQEAAATGISGVERETGIDCRIGEFEREMVLVSALMRFKSKFNPTPSPLRGFNWFWPGGRLN